MDYGGTEFKAPQVRKLGEVQKCQCMELLCFLGPSSCMDVRTLCAHMRMHNYECRHVQISLEIKLSHCMLKSEKVTPYC